MEKETRSRAALAGASGLLALVAGMPLLAQAADEAARAEYAVRWDPKAGGPSTLEEAAAAIARTGGSSETITVRYFNGVSQEASSPGFAAILRERRKPNKFELTYKLRGDAKPPAWPAAVDWKCPAGKAKPKDMKDEFDVSFTGLDTFSRGFSRSCTVDDKNAPPPVPPGLQATRLPCSSQVASLEYDDGTTIELWSMEGKGSMIEVSRKAEDSDANRNTFSKEIVGPLITRSGIVPVKAGMSAWGGECPSANRAADRIQAIVVASSCTAHSWKDRGRGRIGYFHGMALSYGRAACALRQDPSSVAARVAAAGYPPERDALAHYGKADGSNEDRLRALYTLALGEGMRESSGNTSEGPDRSVPASRQTAETAEAGLFQQSHDSIRGDALLARLFADPVYQGDRCLLGVFMQGYKDKRAPVIGSGEAARFQRLTKECPAFATDYALVMFRTNLRHFGPIKRKEAEWLPACAQMLAEVESAALAGCDDPQLKAGVAAPAALASAPN